MARTQIPELVKAGYVAEALGVSETLVYRYAADPTTKLVTVRIEGAPGKNHGYAFVKKSVEAEKARLPQ